MLPQPLPEHGRSCLLVIRCPAKVQCRAGCTFVRRPMSGPPTRLYFCKDRWGDAYPVRSRSAAAPLHASNTSALRENWSFELCPITSQRVHCILHQTLDLGSPRSDCAMQHEAHLDPLFHTCEHISSPNFAKLSDQLLSLSHTIHDGLFALEPG